MGLAPNLNTSMCVAKEGKIETWRVAIAQISPYGMLDCSEMNNDLDKDKEELYTLSFSGYGSTAAEVMSQPLCFQPASTKPSCSIWRILPSG